MSSGIKYHKNYLQQRLKSFADPNSVCLYQVGIAKNRQGNYVPFILFNPELECFETGVPIPVMEIQSNKALPDWAAHDEDFKAKLNQDLWSLGYRADLEKDLDLQKLLLERIQHVHY